MFTPVFTITAGITKSLMAIEADRQAVVELPMDVAMLASLRKTARLVSTHYSTQIEGNRLTQAQVKKAVEGKRLEGRERDVTEVRHYYRAMEEVERLATIARKSALTEQDVRRIHGLVMTGKATPTAYREKQNVIRDSASGRIVYMPPEAKEVPGLMRDLVTWVNQELDQEELPVPLVAGLAHYQFATIHPYFDGNGRTARLLTTLILHRAGYGLKGIYSLEEYYARQLRGYYEALTVGPSHNYHLGRAEADVTGFLTYFCAGMAESFAAVRARAAEVAKRGARDVTPTLRTLDPRQRRLLELFREHGIVSAAEIATHLRLSQKTVVGLCRAWVESGFLAMQDPSRKGRTYRLGGQFEGLVE